MKQCEFAINLLKTIKTCCIVFSGTHFHFLGGSDIIILAALFMYFLLIQVIFVGHFAFKRVLYLLAL